MNLPFFAKKKKPEYFLALLIKEESIAAVVFEKRNNAVQIIGQHQESLRDLLHNLPIETLIEFLDKTISIAEDALPVGIETHKTIFGVEESWVDETKIKREYLVKLKKISDSLSLEPIGFIVITEALSHYLHKQEGAPVSALFVDIGKKRITVTLVRAGRITETKLSDIHESAAITVDFLLKEFTSAEVLPSRIIISSQYGRPSESDHEKLVQEFIAHSWSKSLPFLHMPQVSSLTMSVEKEAVLFGAASQLGLEVLDSRDQEMDAEDLKQQDRHHEKEIQEQKTRVATHKDFGFFHDTDVSHQKNNEEKKTIVVLDNKESPEEEEEEEEIAYENVRKPSEMVPFNGHLKEHQKESASFFYSMTRSFASFGNIGRFIPRVSFAFGKKILIVPPLVLGIFSTLLVIYTFLLKSSIVITMMPERIEENKDLTFLAESKSDFSKHLIGAELISVSEDGKASIPATGKKDVGEKAKGTATLYSRFTQARALVSGTTLTSSTGLEFILDKEVSIASASADASAQPVTTKAAVTASAIGKESNLPSGVKFTVGTFDSSILVAKNETAFSGGSKKEVTVVSAQDIDTLSDDLPKQLEKKAKTDVVKKVSQDSVLIPLFTNTKLSKSEFDEKVGDEAKTVTLTGTVIYDALAYRKNGVLEYAKSQIQDRIPPNLSPIENGLTFNIKKTKAKNGKEISAAITIRALLLPSIDKSKIRQEIVGKSIEDAEEILKRFPQVSSVSIRNSFDFPLLPKLLSRKKENIEITIKTK